LAFFFFLFFFSQSVASVPDTCSDAMMVVRVFFCPGREGGLRRGYCAIGQWTI
jgi:hypothetical protein